jgi:hypothetical protein
MAHTSALDRVVPTGALNRDNGSHVFDLYQIIDYLSYEKQTKY